MLLAKTVSTAFNYVEFGIRIGLLCLSGIVQINDSVLCAVDDENRTEIGLDLLDGIHINHIFYIAPAQLHRTAVDDLRNILRIKPAKAELDDKVMGLDSGADDYLTKPFMTKELLARLRALGRRTLGTTDGVLSYGDISLDTATLTLSCTRNGQSVRLSEKEYHILEYFIANGGQVLTREQLASKVWGFDCDAEYNNVEVYMSFTRKKLAFVEARTEIKAVQGVGYELRYGDV